MKDIHTESDAHSTGKNYQEDYLLHHKDLNQLPDPNALHPIDYIEPEEDQESTLHQQARVFSLVVEEILRIVVDSNQPKLVGHGLCLALNCEHLLKESKQKDIALRHGVSPQAVNDRVKKYRHKLEAIYKDNEN